MNSHSVAECAECADLPLPHLYLTVPTPLSTACEIVPPMFACCISAPQLQRHADRRPSIGS